MDKQSWSRRWAGRAARSADATRRLRCAPETRTVGQPNDPTSVKRAARVHRMLASGLFRAGPDQRRARRAASKAIAADTQLSRAYNLLRPDLHAARTTAQAEDSFRRACRSTRATATCSTTTAGSCASRAATRKRRRVHEVAMAQPAVRGPRQDADGPGPVRKRGPARRPKPSAACALLRARRRQLRSPATTSPACCTAAATQPGAVLHPPPEQQRPRQRAKRCGWASRWSAAWATASPAAASASSCGSAFPSRARPLLRRGASMSESPGSRSRADFARSARQRRA